MDWYSRKVLSWRFSNSMDTSFCCEALSEAIEKYGAPEIFNTDQGSVCCSCKRGRFERTQDSYISFGKDEGRPFEVGFQERASNHLKRLLLRVVVVSIEEKSDKSGR